MEFEKSAFNFGQIEIRLKERILKKFVAGLKGSV